LFHCCYWQTNRGPPCLPQSRLSSITIRHGWRHRRFWLTTTLLRDKCSQLCFQVHYVTV